MYKMEIQSITDITLAELEAICTSMGEPAYRAKTNAFLDL